MDASLGDALTHLEPELLEADYALLGYPRGNAPDLPPAALAAPLTLRIDDPYETTLLVPADLADSLPTPQTRTSPLRAIVLAGVLDPTLTGFMAMLTGAMAERGIPVVPIGAASRDHLLVPARDWPEAFAILRGLRDAARLVQEP